MLETILAFVMGALSAFILDDLIVYRVFPPGKRKRTLTYDVERRGYPSQWSAYAPPTVESDGDE